MTPRNDLGGLGGQLATHALTRSIQPELFGRNIHTPCAEGMSDAVMVVVVQATIDFVNRDGSHINSAIPEIVI